MSINQRASLALKNMLTRHGFDVELQQNVPSASAFDETPSTWGFVKVLRAVWVNTPAGSTSLVDGRPASMARPTLYVAYDDLLAGTSTVSGRRIVYAGMAYGLQATTIEGDKVGLLLALSDGTYIGEAGDAPVITLPDDIIDGGACV